MEKVSKEYIPFGPEWEKELMKWNKKMLIQQLKEKCKEVIRLSEKKIFYPND